ncbi:DNA/RNA non-specific endonuclease [Streptomyces sp. DH12]|uniref:DNA/RNA non-specific endonuclease n=1 Tax=Streptomyces sp. DH12 TaxID=2857010 RepID=UPI001E4B2085|nr:DNA/RNA non-specific endonuclease [Streptomyces sp. DH12]
MVATAAAVASSGGTATAASAPTYLADRGSAVTEGPTEHTITSEMTTVRVTELVTTTPDRAGDVTVRLADGKTIPIPAAHKDLVMSRAARQAKSRLKAAEPRPCGITWVRLKEKSNRHPFAMETGFEVLGGSAIGYKWRVTIKGPNDYAHEYTSQGNLALRGSWQGGYTSDENQDEGLYTAELDPGVSHFQFLNGDICVAEPARRTERLTKPKAACLKMMQANSRDGWILNSTQPVPHRNRTDPTSPAGTRAAGAQACLRKKLGDGSLAAGDITGWQDAQVFARPHAAPGTPAPYGLARCHLIAYILGGKGQVRDGGQDNLVPCWQVGMNTGTPSMRTYEKAVKDAVDATTMGPDDAVYYQVTPLYKNDASTIPTGVTMSAAIQRADGTQSLLPITGVTNTKGNTGLLNLGN